MMVNVKIRKEGKQTAAYINDVLFLKGDDSSTVIQAVIDEMDHRSKSIASDTQRIPRRETKIRKEVNT